MAPLTWAEQKKADARRRAEKALKRAKGNITHAAVALGIPRTYLQRLVKVFEIKVERESRRGKDGERRG